MSLERELLFVDDEPEPSPARGQGAMVLLAFILAVLLTAKSLGLSDFQKAVAANPSVAPSAILEVNQPDQPKKADLSALMVDANTAALEDWDSLPKIGPVLARRIMMERENSGPFRSVEDLSNRVKGIGPKIQEQLRPLLRFSSEPDSSKLKTMAESDSDESLPSSQPNASESR